MQWRIIGFIRHFAFYTIGSPQKMAGRRLIPDLQIRRGYDCHFAKQNTGRALACRGLYGIGLCQINSKQIVLQS